MLETVEIVTGEHPVGSVIWLHGLGADGHDFEPIVPELRLPAALPLRFIFPHAPLRPVTLNGGMSMRAWFDIFSLDKSGPVDETGIRASVEGVSALIAAELDREIPAKQIVLAGFSQGGVIATYLALTHREQLAGLVALSTYLPMPVSLAAELSAASAGLPILGAHGEHDPVLPISLGRDLRDWMQAAELRVRWLEYPMAHAVCPQEIADIGSFLRDTFAAAIGD